MNICGHEKEIEQLNNIICQNKVGHAYLFYGKEGIGKKKVAIDFAKNLLCTESKNGKCCDECMSCKFFNHSPDFYIIEPDKGLIKVDEIRKLEKEVYLIPTYSNRKCAIINDADLMNESAQNALLKILEEPPKYLTIILIASNKARLLNTIKSRTVTINFAPLNNDELQTILGDKVNKEAIDFALGSAKKAEDYASNNYLEVAKDLIEKLITKDYLEANKILEKIKSDKNIKTDIYEVLEFMALVCFKRLEEDPDRYAKYIDLIEETNRKIQRNANLDLALDDLVLKVCF